MRNIIFVVLVILLSCAQQEKENTVIPKVRNQSSLLTKKDSLKISKFWNKANQSGLYTVKRQEYLDSALMIKPDSAYFWQQKAMPLYKERKYSLGKPFLEKAVLYNPKKYLDYSAFMKCLFSKEYEESIEEFGKVKKLYGDSYVMDHTYNFYMGLCYLQLNQFALAKQYFLQSKEQQVKDFPGEAPEDACHYLDWFYLGIASYELGEYKKAIEYFDLALKTYKNFGDALYYKAICLALNANNDEAKSVMKLARDNKHNTINEDQVVYVIYPYQVFHSLRPKKNEIPHF